ncbi:hypothetical protein X777_06603, partial [Ooceraea biroi]
NIRIIYAWIPSHRGITGNEVADFSAKKKCWFCAEGWDSLKHYVGECREVKEWFIGLG